jgi:hypothetical protein
LIHDRHLRSWVAADYALAGLWTDDRPGEPDGPPGAALAVFRLVWGFAVAVIATHWAPPVSDVVITRIDPD